MKLFSRSLLILAFLAVASAQTPKRVPPAGVPIPEADRKELEAGVAALGADIEKLRGELRKRPELAAVLPDVQIFHKAVDWALRYDEFLDVKQVRIARLLLTRGTDRATDLRAGQTPWLEKTGLVVRGYQSQIDGSIQPYGLLIPEDWKPEDKTPRRLDFWFHGRGEQLTELDFLNGQMKNRGEFTPPSTIVCFLYGRFCNANKFAGERDLFEAWTSVKARYPIHENRVVVRGFSMGGAACWQFATHYAGLWAAAAPGAGFAETAEFSHVFDAGKEPPPAWEQTLWRWYDATDYAANLADVPLVAYSGEIDHQKQAADIMLRFAEKEGLTFPHIIGPQTAHQYHKESKPKIEEFVTAAAAKGRQVTPKKSHWTTYTLIYPQSGNPADPAIVGMEKEWERADLDLNASDSIVPRFTTKNVSRFTWVPTLVGTITVDGQSLPVHGLTNNPNHTLFTKTDGKWSVGFDSAKNPAAGLRKQPGSCGPIDHALMSRFLFVRPTGKPLNDMVGAWAKSEMEHAANEWRRVFRGEAPSKDDTAITADDIANANLILWGDPSSNALLRKIANQLPLKWSKESLEFSGVKYDATHTAPILIYPNPLNSNRYIVINSGHTFREDANNSNANQTPKLPDWAIVDLRTPPNSRWPGKIEAAGFFDEQWRVTAK